MQSISPIAIIDDSPSMRRALDSLLRSLGFAVLSFESAEAFLAAAPAELSCIVTDVEMPGISGIELHDVLCQQGSKLPFIFITANSEQTVRLRLGPSACVLSKPFEVTELADCIRRSIQGA